MIKYNDYEFTDRAQMQITMESVYDASARSVIQQKYRVTVRDMVYPDSPGATNNNDPMNNIKARLLDPAQRLVISDWGFGSELVVVPNHQSANEPGLEDGRRVDTDSGPKPRLLAWLPIGATNVAEINWQCDFSLAPCSDGSAGLESLVYAVMFDISQKGYTTRNVTGHLTIAQQQMIEDGQDNVHADSADLYRELIYVEPMLNAARSQQYKLSEDKKRLDFTIRDQEHESPNAYPTDVVSISAPLRMRVKRPNPTKALTTHEFSLRLELTAEAPRMRAWEIFQALLVHRISRFVGQVNIVLVLEDMFLSEDPYSNEYVFGVGYKLLGPFNQLVQLGGWFQPGPEQDWSQWKAGMLAAESQRGYGGLIFAADNAAELVSPCNQTDVRVETGFHDIPTPFPVSLAEICNSAPPPDKSYLRFDARLVEAPDTKQVHHTTYGLSEFEARDVEWQTDDDAQPFWKKGAGSDYEEVISKAPPDQLWLWSGVAERVTYKIPTPALPSIGGKPTTLVGKPRILRRQLGWMFCQPVYQLVWNMALRVKDSPDTIPNEDRTGLNDQGEGDGAP